MDPLHIKMATLKTIEDWLKDSGWTSALSEADIETSGAADFSLHAAHITKTRSAHQVNINSIRFHLNFRSLLLLHTF